MIESDLQESIAGHAARDAALLEDLRGRGVNPDRLHAVEHHFWAPDQHSAVQLVKKLYELDYLILVLSPVDDEGGSKLWTSRQAFNAPSSLIHVLHTVPAPVGARRLRSNRGGPRRDKVSAHFGTGWPMDR